MKSFEVETAHWGRIEYKADWIAPDIYGGLVLSAAGRRIGYLRKGQWGAWWEKASRLVPEEPEGPEAKDGFNPDDYMKLPGKAGQTPYRGTFEPREKPVLP